MSAGNGMELDHGRRALATGRSLYGYSQLIILYIVISVVYGCVNTSDSDSISSVSTILYTEDGYQLEATVFPSASDNPPGLILAHRLGSDRHEWDAFAARAQEQGYLCIAFDARGHGRGLTSDGRTVSHRNFRGADWNTMTNDFAAAKEELVRRGADRENLAVIGAELGGSAGLFYSRSDPEIQSIVLLSPGRKYKIFDAEAAIREMRETPILLVTSEGDSYSLSSSMSLKEAAPGYCELRTYSGSRLGSDILAFSDSATAHVFQWLSETLTQGE